MTVNGITQVLPDNAIVTNAKPGEKIVMTFENKSREDAQVELKAFGKTVRINGNLRTSLNAPALVVPDGGSDLTITATITPIGLRAIGQVEIGELIQAAPHLVTGEKEMSEITFELPVHA